MTGKKPSGAPSLTLHKGIIIAVVSLIVIGGLAAAIAIPLSQRDDPDSSSSSSSSASPLSSASASPTAASTFSDSPSSPASAASSPASAAAPALAPTLSSGQCTYKATSSVVAIDPRVPAWPSADGTTWVDSPDGISYRPDITDPAFVSPPEASAPRAYPFTVSDPGHYMFLMQSSAEHRTEFNDVWMRFNHGGGVRFWHVTTGLSATPGTRGWSKWFSNDGEGHLGGLTIDNNGHSIATVDELVPGQVYTLELAGRSPRFEIHRLFAVRCQKKTCAKTGFSDRLARKAEDDDQVTACV